MMNPRSILGYFFSAKIKDDCYYMMRFFTLSITSQLFLKNNLQKITFFFLPQCGKVLFLGVRMQISFLQRRGTAKFPKI